MKSQVGAGVRRLMAMNNREWPQDEFINQVIPSFPASERRALMRLMTRGSFEYLKYWLLVRTEAGVVVRLNPNLYEAAQRQRSQTPQVEQTPVP